ncbi:nuclear pore complex protein NUP62 isoform X2 [Rhodamnia argentea]|uniref:Nuclear pore complex protein NUP62 isoform X2 n=1 Tax=Rhodamnia argentea TaxID=178133 RepID=A0A8B8PMD7_9MYRT|nr:nuclear pore complex protein NUP62 isoform X2 [Rhodamnia argentea]
MSGFSFGSSAGSSFASSSAAANPSSSSSFAALSSSASLSPFAAASNPSSSPAPAPFGFAPSSSSSSASSAPAFFSGFGSAPATSAPTLFGSSAPASSFAGFGVTATPASSATASSVPSFSLSTKPSTPASSQAPSTTTVPAFSVPATTTTTASTASTTTAPTPSLIVASSSGTTSSTSAAVAVPKLPSEIVGKTVEEIIKEWNAELQERTGKFRKQANAIAEWDKRILKNRDVLLRLEIEVAKVVETQGSLERQLELIETHQQEVDNALQSVEEEAERIYKDERGLLLDDEAASTRDAMYEQAELIERELEQMTEQIKSVIQTLNSSQGGELDNIDGMTPLDAVVRILNNQLSSLMWVDEKAEEFSSRIQKLATQGSAAGRELMGPKLWMS